MKKQRVKLVIGIASSALFDLKAADEVFKRRGTKAYMDYQRRNEKRALRPGTAFSLVRALLGWNQLLGKEGFVEVIVVSRNDIDTSIRIFNSIQHHKLAIERGAFTGGRPVARYLKPLGIDLFLSANEEDVRGAREADVASGFIYPKPPRVDVSLKEVRLAFDGDAVIFSDEAEMEYQKGGLRAFVEHEVRNASRPLAEGPFANLLRTLSRLQAMFSREQVPLRTALITSRGCPSHERIVRTLRAWGVRIDEAFLMSGMPKEEIVRSFSPHIYFDDMEAHCGTTSTFVPTARVPQSDALRKAVKTRLRRKKKKASSQR